jgi:hypothetical protein
MSKETYIQLPRNMSRRAIKLLPWYELITGFVGD